MELVINEDNLQFDEVQEFSSKVRALLVDEKNHILIAKYGNVILLPGGKVDDGETVLMAITRELGEELGQYYDCCELDFLARLNYYQRDYPKISGIFRNRLVQTTYFIGAYKGVNKELQKFTEKEQNGNFRLELVSLDDLENIIFSNENDNPRNIYFQRELLTILAAYKNKIQDISVKKLELK